MRMSIFNFSSVWYVSQSFVGALKDSIDPRVAILIYLSILASCCVLGFQVLL